MPLRAAHAKRFRLSPVAGIFTVLTGLPVALLCNFGRSAAWVRLTALRTRDAGPRPAHRKPRPQRRPRPPGRLAELRLRTGRCWCLWAEEHTPDSEILVNSVYPPREITSTLDPNKRQDPVLQPRFSE